MQIHLREQSFILLPEKALWKTDQSLLLIADIHLGKASHFRKEGVAMPLASQLIDYANLRNLFQKTKPQTVFFLGDLFHSTFNKDWYHFEKLLQEFNHITFTLIKGNHDLVPKEILRKVGIHIIETYHEDEHFIYSHKPVTFAHNKLNIAGHIHPGIALNGIGRQSARLPCFYLRNNLFLLPAFGSLTGLSIMPYHKTASTYVVLAEEVKKIMI